MFPLGLLDWAGTLRQARVDAPAVPGKWPVVLFSPGLQAPREFYAGAADDLASRGYVVVTVSHTYESLAVEFPGNRVEYGAHFGFSDLQWAVPQIAQVTPERRADLIGTIDPRDALRAQHDYLAAFFDLHLKHRATVLFDRPRHPGIRLVN